MGADSVPGVDDQVHHRRLKLTPVRPDNREVAAVFRDQGDILGQDAPQQYLELRDQLTEIKALPLDRLLAGEGEKLANKLSRAGRGLADLVQPFVGGIAHRVSLGQFVQLHEDRHEKVVEVVGHATGQLTDSLHLLALRKLKLDLLLL